MLLKFIASLAIALALHASAHASEPASTKSGPDARMGQLLDTFKTIKVHASEGAALSAEERKANETAFKAADAYFDFDRLTAAAIAPHKKALSADQLTRYHRDFSALIRLVAFPRSGAFVQQAKVELSPAAIIGKKADVAMHGHMPDDDIDTRIVFKWEDVAGQWRVTDVSFDGVSMVKDYQNQFGKLIKKDGAEGFLKKLQSRLEQERKNDDA